MTGEQLYNKWMGYSKSLGIRFSELRESYKAAWNKLAEDFNETGASVKLAQVEHTNSDDLNNIT